MSDKPVKAYADSTWLQEFNDTCGYNFNREKEDYVETEVLIYTPAQIETLVRDLVEDLYDRPYAIAEDILEELKKQGWI